MLLRIQRNAFGQDKPMGWSFWTTRSPRDGFFLGTVAKPLSLTGIEDTTGFPYEFKEWFFRLPLIGWTLVLTRISPPKEWRP